MSNSNNAETKQALVSDIKQIQARCIDTYNIVVNSPLYYATVSSNDIPAQSLSYFEALRTEISNLSTPIPTNSNFITSQFLAEMIERTDQVDELIAFTRGSIYDVDNEIERLNNLVKMGKEAISQPQLNMQDLSPVQLKQAKETFQVLKSELHSLIQSMFPNTHDIVTDMFSQLIQEHSNEGSNGYISITPKTYCIIEVLKDKHIVTTNPYNNLEVKLAL